MNPPRTYTPQLDHGQVAVAYSALWVGEFNREAIRNGVTMGQTELTRHGGQFIRSVVPLLSYRRRPLSPKIGKEREQPVVHKVFVPMDLFGSQNSEAIQISQILGSRNTRSNTSVDEVLDFTVRLVKQRTDQLERVSDSHSRSCLIFDIIR